MAQPVPSPAQLESQLTQLQHLLHTLSTTRSSLPSLLRSFSPSPSSSSNPGERAAVYRAASSHVTSSIRQLGEELLEAESVLQAAEVSGMRDPNGVVMKAVGSEGRGVEGWERLGEILGSSSSSGRDAKGKGRAFEPHLGDVGTPGELESLLRSMEQSGGGRLKLESVGKQGKEQHEVRLTLRGVMRAVLSLHWSSREEEEGLRVCMVERVGCFGLKEEKASYLQSQYSLFNNITKTAMETVGSGRRRGEKEAKERSNVEEVLTLLAGPPLPF